MSIDKYFIDCHCHLFNVEHVPLRQAIRRVIENFNRGLLKRGLIAAGALGLGGIFGAGVALGSNKIAREFYKRFQAFIRFFDQPIQRNIQDLVQSLKALRSQAELDQRLRIFTPLIMDFERCEDYKHLATQVEELKTAIADSEDLLATSRTRILPFVGMDLRRFHDVPKLSDVPAVLAAFLSGVGVDLRPAAERRNPAGLNNGDFIGIKLYPSLGFDVFPKDLAERERNVEVLREVMRLDLPITVHCQLGSYACDPGEVPDATLINHANPEKWWRLFEAYPDLKALRINFAHFGGEDGVASVLMWHDFLPDPQASYLAPADGLSHSSWTYWILRLVKTCPNAFADLSAFDFTIAKAVASLAWLLARDAQGVYAEEGGYPLIGKLLWGSDVPMVLSDFGTYKDLFEAFLKVADLAHSNTGNYGLPEARDLPGRDELLEQLLDTNPRRFLFGA